MYEEDSAHAQSETAQASVRNIWVSYYVIRISSYKNIPVYAIPPLPKQDSAQLH